eukprot:1839573-Amphidinium_carterae.4
MESICESDRPHEVARALKNSFESSDMLMKLYANLRTGKGSTRSRQLSRQMLSHDTNSLNMTTTRR